MKKPFSLRPALLFLLTLPFFLSYCKKINEATLLGDDLVPEVDNINTFETSFATETDNVLVNDTAKLNYADAVALGNITNDAAFGQTTASVYFQINPVPYGAYPFSAVKDSITIDSVVLSLAYITSYGDANIPQTVQVYEVAQASSFNDTTFYGFNETEFETTGTALGSATFTMSKLKDSVPVIRKDTVRVANQLRIKLDDNALGERLASYDTFNTSNGGYHSDTIFKTLFRGFALKADGGTGNGLAFFDLSNTAKTHLTVYYHAIKNGAVDTGEAVFTHALRYVNATDLTTSKGGQANIIKRQAAGGWASYLGDGTPVDDQLYIQSAPGSAGYITIPALDTFQNKLIHRAELVVTRIPSTDDALFTAPDQLFVDRVKTSNGIDSAFVFPEFLAQTSSGTIAFNFSSFGGHLRSDNTYRFNITAAVQDIIARDSTNDRLRIYAPFDTRPYDARTNPAIARFVQAIPYPAYGRVVLAGGNYAEESKRLRLRVIYSKL